MKTSKSDRFGGGFFLVLSYFFPFLYIFYYFDDFQEVLVTERHGYFLFSSILGEMIQFDKHICTSWVLQPPTTSPNFWGLLSLNDSSVFSVNFPH